MKKVVTILFLFFSLTTFCQSNPTVQVEKFDATTEFTNNVKQFFTDYFEMVKRGDWENAMNKMPSSYYSLIPKETLVTQIKQAFINEAFTTTFNEMTYKEITSTFKFENIVYGSVNYQSSFTFNFIKSDTQTDNEFDVFIGFMEGTFKTQFKTQKVERNGNNITISGLKSILIIDDPKEGELKMLEIDNGLKEFYKLIFPEPVIIKMFSK